MTIYETFLPFPEISRGLLIYTWTFAAKRHANSENKCPQIKSTREFMYSKDKVRWSMVLEKIIFTAVDKFHFSRMFTKTRKKIDTPKMVNEGKRWSFENLIDWFYV